MTLPAQEKECSRLASARASARQGEAAAALQAPGGLADRRGGLGRVSDGAVTGAGSLFAAAPSSSLTGGYRAAPGLRDQEG